MSLDFVVVGQEVIHELHQLVVKHAPVARDRCPLRLRVHFAIVPCPTLVLVELVVRGIFVRTRLARASAHEDLSSGLAPGSTIAGTRTTANSDTRG